jgi:energy-coupling factor transporter ATP-binding protein EcfA2
MLKYATEHTPTTMKVTRLEAHKVHGYLPIRIEFLPDITFLTGLNGSGKTTALRLLMGLLAPNVDELIDIMFTSAAVTVADATGEIVLQASRSPEGLTLTTTEVQDTLSLSTAELQLLVEARHRDERPLPVHQKITVSPVYQSIARMSTPMFLSLDRRLYLEGSTPHRASRLREWGLEHRRLLERPFHGSVSTVLSDVNNLIGFTMSEIRALQEGLDENLRNQIFLDSFRYVAADSGARTKLPTRSALEQFRARQATVESAAAGLRLPIGPLQSALADFFDRMNKIVDAVEKQSEVVRPPKKSGKQAKAQSGKEIPVLNAAIFEWILNERQADRIFKQIGLLEKYISDRVKVREPINRFLELTNGFLSETKKSVRLNDRDFLEVVLDGVSQPRPLFALSSGERQLVVMLAHLSLNKELSGSGVFVVDEPELSLHISWQEKFVDAIQRANPDVQLIMATHSPAIIMEKVDNCRNLN